MAINICPITEENFDDVAKWLNVPHVNRWLNAEWRNRDINRKHIAIASQSPKNYMWVGLHNNQTYGLVVVGDINVKDRCGVAWYLRNPFIEPKSGVMTKLVDLVVRKAFQELNLHSISASTQLGNVASEKLLRRIGFRSVGTLREAFIVEGEFVDRNLFDILEIDLI